MGRSQPGALALAAGLVVLAAPAAWAQNRPEQERESMIQRLAGGDGLLLREIVLSGQQDALEIVRAARDRTTQPGMENFFRRSLIQLGDPPAILGVVSDAYDADGNRATRAFRLLERVAPKMWAARALPGSGWAPEGRLFVFKDIWVRFVAGPGLCGPRA